MKLNCEKNKESIKMNNDSSVVLCLFIAEQPITRITKNICDGALCDWFNENASSILTKQFRLIISLDTDRMICEFNLYVGHKTLRI